MQKIIPYIFIFLLGILVTYLFIENRKNSSENTIESVAIINEKIEKLNKLVVEEDTYAEIYTYKNAKNFLGKWLTFDKKLILLTKAKVQASYDMRKMDVRLDTIKHIIYIQKTPDLKVEIFSDIDFHDMEQSNFNKFESQEINQIKKKAVAQIEKKIDKVSLEKRAKEQLIRNLSEIYLLAKLYGWKIEDNTSYKTELKKITSF